jgi:hypothetical protein
MKKAATDASWRGLQLKRPAGVQQVTTMSISKTAWFAVAILLAVTNVLRAAYFDWSDLGLHVLIAVVCALLALRWSKLAATAAGAVLLAAVLAFTFWSVPQDWNEIEAGDDWQELRRTLGSPVYEAANLDQARNLARGWSAPSPFRFRQTGPVAIYLRGDRALWVFHNGKVVEATYVGGS